MVHSEFQVYYAGRPSEELAALKNAALYSDKIFMPKLNFIQNILGGKLDPYTCFSVGLTVDTEYDKCLSALEEAGILVFDENATSKERVEICGKIIDYMDEKEREKLIDLIVESEEMKALTKVYNLLLKDEEFRKRYGKKLMKIDLVWEHTLYLLCVYFAFNNNLLGAIEHSAYPLTDDKFFSQLLELRVAQLRKIKKGLLKEAPLFSNKVTNVQKRMMIVSEAFNLCVPYFYKIPAEKILEIRDDERKSLQKFKQKINQLSLLIENESWDAKLKSEVMKIVRNEIMEKVNDIDYALRNAYYDMVKKIGKAEIALGTVGLTGLVLQGLPSFIAVLGASSVYALKSLWEYFVEKEKIRENSLYYIYKVYEATENVKHNRSNL